MGDTDAVYERRKRFLAIASEAVFGVERDSPVHPSRVLEEMEARSPSIARDGLQLTINDLVEATNGIVGDDIARWDELLTSAGAATLSEVRIRFGKTLRAVVRRGVIRSEAAYYLVRNAAEVAPAFEAKKLSTLLAEFEAKAAKHV